MELDLLDGELYAGDAAPTWAWLRRERPLYRDEKNGLWAVSRHADVAAIGRDPVRFVSSRGYRPKLPADASMIGRDEPEHGAQRRVFARRLTRQRVRALEPRIRATAVRLIEAFAGRGRCDLVRELAVPLPVITILELLGFDPEAWPRFARWSEITNAAGGGPRYFHAGVLEAIEAYFAEARARLLARRAAPRDDAFSWMLAAREAGEAVRGDDEILMESLLLLNGGSDTTRHVIAGATAALLDHPEQWQRLRREPARIPVAVEEFIRWVTPLVNMRRSASRDVDLHGQRIREGDEVLLLYGAANRDERVFREPERFDVDRRPNPHLAFGFGAHFCLGASLARLELRVVFEELLRRIREPRWAPGAAPRIVPNAFTRGLDSLPVVFTPEPPT